jgi:polysaccharide export outer membrane protein
MLLLIVFFTAALAAPRAGGAQESEYVVAAHDVLTITVWAQPDLSGKFIVDEDGTFAFPLIGRVKADGLSPHAIEDQIRARLTGRFFKNPQVSVAMDQYHSQRVNVVGEVRLPGSYPLVGQMTLIDALAKAGSATDRAGTFVLITRAPHPLGTAGTPESAGTAAAATRVDIRSVQSGSAAQNVVLHDGDTVFVPPADTFFVSGHVHNPGSFALREQTTVLQGVALAGGLTDRGSNRRIQIIRLAGGKRQTFDARPGDVLQPGDTIVVRERLF